jgi:nucleoside-diphosphate-sugar epimerase
LIDGITKLFFSEGITTPINLGNPVPVTMIDLAREIIEITGSSSEIVFKELPQDDPRERRPDITKAETLLNWHPIVSRSDGLRKTLSYIRGN